MAGAGKLAVAIVVAACAAPSAAANVLPRLTALFTSTAATSGDVAVVATLIMSSLIMAACPFAVRQARNLLEKVAFLVVGFGLATFNFAMAHDTIGQLRDGAAAPVRQLQSQTAALKSRIASAEAVVKQVPRHPWTTTEMVAIAREAVASAETARAQECGKVGDNCRLRVAEKGAAEKDLAAVEANRALTVRLENIERQRVAAQTALDNLGYVPESADKSASRLAKDVGRWVDLGDDPDAVLVDWLIKVTAGTIELIGLVGPRMILLAMFGDLSQERRAWRLPPWLRRRQPDAAETAQKAEPSGPLAAVKTATLRRTAATPVTAKKPRQIKAAAVGDVDSVRQWKEARTVTRAGSEIKPKETYDGSYLPWCVEHDVAPVSFTRFGTIMKGDLGVTYVDRNKRGFYVGIALVATPKLIHERAGGKTRSSNLGSLATA
jgi:hypothetical protein